MNTNKLTFRNALLIGSLIFGMLFGAGNLIFPVHLSSASHLRSKSYPLRISASARLLCLSSLLHTSPEFTIV